MAMDEHFKTATELMAEAGSDGEDFEEAMSEPDAPGNVVKITEDGGVTKEIVKPGSGWEEPEKGDKVRVHYVGTLTDGTKFDSSRDRDEPFEFTLGQGQVIKGWDLGVAKMKKGEVSKLTITADYGYGESGSPPKIPGGATLVFEVELIDWKSVKDIAGDGGVIKTIVKEGSGWAKPQSQDEVCVRFSARVQGTAEPFYTTPEQGEEFTLAGPAHFCRAISTGAWQPGWHAGWHGSGACSLPVGRAGDAGRGLVCLSALLVYPDGNCLTATWDPPPSCLSFPAAAATMKKEEEVKLVVKPEYGFGAEGRGSEVPPNATLEIDMALLGWKKVEKVTMDGAVMKKTLVDTEEWKKPNEGSQVTVTYTARVLPDGPVFDQKSEEEPLQFTTDEGQVIEGLDLAVMKMKEGERALVTIAPQYAWGEQGSQQPLASVPAGATVEYDITLKSFVKAKDSWEMDTAEKLAAAATQKDKGNAAFKAGQYAKAVQRYDKAMQAIEYDEQFSADEKKAARDIKKSCNLNLAAAHLKLGNPAEARKAADKVLERDGGNLKALYRRAQAYLATADYLEAEQDIRKGLIEDPNSTDFKLLLKKLKAAEAAAVKKERGLFAGMMKGLSGGGSKAAKAAADEAAPAAGAEENAAANGDAAPAPMEQA